MPQDFQESLHRKTPSVVVAFASGAGRFEWGRTLDAIGVDHVLMRDTTDRWYLRGVQGIGNVFDVCNYLIGLGERYKRVILLGLSSGSYAALFYGSAVTVDLVVAISPITGKGDKIRDDFDPWWWHRIEHGPEHAPVGDLKTISGGLTAKKTIAFVSDGEGTELDRTMAERIGIPPQNIFNVAGFSHSGLARGLVDLGIIREILQCG